MVRFVQGREAMKSLLNRARERLTEVFEPQGRQVRLLGTAAIEDDADAEFKSRPGVIVYEERANGSRRELFVPFPYPSELDVEGTREVWLEQLIAVYQSRFPEGID